MIAVLKIILIAYASLFSATSAWYVIFEPNFRYKSNMTFDETVAVFQNVKRRDKLLVPPVVEIDGKTIKQKDTLMAASMYNLVFYDAAIKGIYHVTLYQDGYNQKHPEKKTYILFNYLLFTNGKSIPYVRESLKFSRNSERRKRFEEVVIDKVKADLDSINNLAQNKNRIKRVIHYLQ